MLSLEEWLRNVGFGSKNPFARKQADEEGDALQGYFVEHPAYNALRERELTRSVILAAPRGFGKSTARRMFETFCADRSNELRPLIVPLLDWSWATALREGGQALTWKRYLDEICRRVVQALALQVDANWASRAPNVDQAGYLFWLCVHHSHYLHFSQRQRLQQLAAATWGEGIDPAELDFGSFGLVQHLESLVATVQGLGFQTCYILVDRIDELLETTHDYAAGADLLAPMVANLPMLETPGLVWRCFVPAEIVTVLDERGLLRRDRLALVELSWSGREGRQLLLDLLKNRLTYYSNGRVRSLVELAERGLRDLDDRMVDAAGASPRQLLNLGDQLLRACAKDATENNLLIAARHVRDVLHTTDSEQAEAAPPAATPLLRVLADGSVWRGDVEIAGWRTLPPLQRRLLDYLYARRGELCRKEEIIAALWTHDPINDESALRKLATRLGEFLEPNPATPVYLQKVKGGHYLLRHAV